MKKWFCINKKCTSFVNTAHKELPQPFKINVLQIKNTLPSKLNTIPERLLLISRSNLLRKMYDFDINAIPGIAYINSALTHQINTAAVNLEISAIQNFNNSQNNVSKKNQSRTQFMKNRKQKQHYLARDSIPNFQTYFSNTKQPNPMYITSSIVKKPRIVQKVSKSAIPRKYDALMDHLGISGYNHFELAVIRDLEKREEQKVEATIHTLFENTNRFNAKVVKQTASNTNSSPLPPVEWLHGQSSSFDQINQTKENCSTHKSWKKVLALPSDILISNEFFKIEPELARENKYRNKTSASNVHHRKNFISSSVLSIITPMPVHSLSTNRMDRKDGQHAACISSSSASNCFNKTPNDIEKVVEKRHEQFKSIALRTKSSTTEITPTTSVSVPITNKQLIQSSRKMISNRNTSFRNLLFRTHSQTKKNNNTKMSTNRGTIKFSDYLRNPQNDFL
ncbi:uncharacterized protein LOC131683096 isoform X2 [Topomyia yanbarensis]|uniref:uncharacterized protein LOC131683096 isoform X2 n=1 Tax=Topomyia yanbarensis TaxID=2498891 RepID=UPI00273AAED0|nr:uncharacterized protein LOC131683096 isoform X2 [Topomyia yanbarensis]